LWTLVHGTHAMMMAERLARDVVAGCAVRRTEELVLFSCDCAYVETECEQKVRTKPFL